MEVCLLCKSIVYISLDFLTSFAILFGMHTFFLFFLSILARVIIRVHRPYVIGVTGTVGKTTISRYVSLYLEQTFSEKDVMSSPYHYNGEYGLPLTIIGAKTPGKNPLLWISLIFVTLYRLVRPYPRYLVLEYGIDHPGEMTFLTDIVAPDIAILSVVAPNHLEQFGTLEKYRNEKLLLTKNTSRLIIHESLRSYVEKDALFYGSGGMSDIDASHFHCSIDWVEATVHMEQKDYLLSLPVFGEFQIENALPLYGVAHFLGQDPLHISQISPLLVPEEGRSALIQRDTYTTIIDGSYNGGYESITKWILSLAPFFPSHRVILFLWDMRELWDESESIHRSLADFITEHIPRDRDIEIVFVWPLMKKWVVPLLEPLYRVSSFLSSREAGTYIRNILESENIPTIVYVKGSQNTIFLEEGIKEFLDKKKHSLLCRQWLHWEKRKNAFFESLK